MKQKHESKIMEAIHEEAQALFEAGVINKERMAEYDNACLAARSNKACKTANTGTSEMGEQPATLVYVQTASTRG